MKLPYTFLFSSVHTALWLAALILNPVADAQLVRQANTTLNFPPEAPVYSGFQFENAFPTLTAFTRPVVLTRPPAETNMLFIVEQDGRIQRITDLAGTPSKSLFLNISGAVDSSGNEEGLLGLAFHPNFQSNRYFYVFYTHPNGSSNSTRKDRISRFTAPSNWETTGEVNTSTEYVLIDQRDEAGNHNGGDLHFGADGYLYASLGDEGGSNDSRNNSQTITKDFFAGLIRIDVDKKPGNLEPNPHNDGFDGDAVVRDAGIARYSVPADNPFVGATNFNGIVLSGNVRTEFWATGLRNPWRMAFDPITGRLFVGDVGQNAREEIHLVAKGDNCGWNYREGTLNGPEAGSAPAGFNPVDPIFEYAHGSGGQSVIGGIVYRGDSFPQLYGTYFLSESYDGRVWGLTETAPGSGSFTAEVLASEPGIVAFGEHPGTKDLLAANIGSGQIRKLTASSVSGSLPTTLTATGAFSDLSTLTPHAGIVPYQPNVNFWSDGAVKQRWFSVPDTNNTIGWARDANYTLPPGSIWIKHFDLQTDLGEPAVWKRLETRFLIKTTNGVYGITYQWNPAGTEATLIGEAGEDESIPITLADDSIENQVWSYPSRSQCLQCHTAAGGLALSFNTRQLNRDFTHGTVTTNQLVSFEDAGYFSNTVSAIESLPRVVPLDDTSQSLHFRALSYFDVNCASCHQNGATAPSAWSASLSVPFVFREIFNGSVSFDNGNPPARFAVPGDTTNSMVLSRLEGTAPFGRMPPIGSNVRDAAAEALLADWINQELATYAPYSDWRADQIIDPGEPGEDPDGDGANNERERLTRTDPNLGSSVWNYAFSADPTEVDFSYQRPAGIDVRIESSTNLIDWSAWAEESLDYAVSNRVEKISRPTGINAARYFRLEVSEP